MRLLPIFFPKNPKPRTVVHAGPLLIRRAGGVRELRHYLRTPRRQEVFLVHHGQEPLREVAKKTGTMDIELEAPAKRDAIAATEMALALGARRIDFTIDEPGVSRHEGHPLQRVTLSEAESLARNPEVRPRIRTKLRAGCAALRHGMSRVRIGSPPALEKGQATVLIPDPELPLEVRENPLREIAATRHERVVARPT